MIVQITSAEREELRRIPWAGAARQRAAKGQRWCTTLLVSGGKITCIFLTVPDSSNGNERLSIRGVPLKTGHDWHLHPKPQPQRNTGRLEVEVAQKWACHLGRRLIPWTPHLLLSPQDNAKEIPRGILETGVRVKYRPEAHLSLFYLYPFALNLALRCLPLSPA